MRPAATLGDTTTARERPDKYLIYIYRVDGFDGCARDRNSPMYQGCEITLLRAPTFILKSQTELAYIDILANPKMRFDSVKRMTQIQNIS